MLLLGSGGTGNKVAHILQLLSRGPKVIVYDYNEAKKFI